MKPDEIRQYCLNCQSKPCQRGCPLSNNIPQFIHEENLEKAFYDLCETTVLPAICGRICPYSSQCQGSCIRGIKGTPVETGTIEALIGDSSIENEYKIPKEIDEKVANKKVAVIGAGPAGLTCAAFLARKGVNVTIYEKYNILGGILVHGIPDFRLDKKIVEKTIDKILELGIEVKKNCELGKDYFLKDLWEKYDAVFLSIGANEPIITLQGSNVLSGNKLLELANYPEFKGKSVAVSGGGNVAMDVARTVKRLGADVTIIYRRAEEQMPAEKIEIKEAKEEGVKFLFQNNILSVDDKNLEIECIRTELIKKEGDNRLSPVNVADSNYKLHMDYVIIATGSKIENAVTENLEKNKYGYIEVDENNKTSMGNIFAGGDLVGNKATVAWAARSGRDASNNIINYLKNN